MPLTEEKRALSKSLVRTIVPIIIGALVSALALAGLEVDPGALEPGVYAIVSAAYYALIRVLEERWPKVGKLLGTQGKPDYKAKNSV